MVLLNTQGEIRRLLERILSVGQALDDRVIVFTILTLVSLLESIKREVGRWHYGYTAIMGLVTGL